MWRIHAALCALVSRILTSLGLFSPGGVLLFFSLITSVLLLLVFKATSNSELIRRRKDRLIATVLELLLFRHDPVITLGAFGRALGANGAYLRSLLPSMLTGVPLVVIMTVQVSSWLGARPLRPRESTLLTIRLKETSPVLEQSISISGCKGVSVSGYPVRDVTKNEIHMQIQASGPGEGWIEVGINGQGVRKSVTVSEHLLPIEPVRVRKGFWRELSHPGEPPLPAEGPVSEIRVFYPATEIRIGRWNMNWMFSFLLLTLLMMLVLRKPLRVEF